MKKLILDWFTFICIVTFLRDYYKINDELPLKTIWKDIRNSPAKTTD